MLEADLRTAIDSANDSGHFYLLMEHIRMQVTHIRPTYDTELKTLVL